MSSTDVDADDEHSSTVWYNPNRPGCPETSPDESSFFSPIGPKKLFHASSNGSSTDDGSSNFTVETADITQESPPKRLKLEWNKETEALLNTSNTSESSDDDKDDVVDNEADGQMKDFTEAQGKNESLGGKLGIGTRTSTSTSTTSTYYRQFVCSKCKKDPCAWNLYSVRALQFEADIRAGRLDKLPIPFISAIQAAKRYQLYCDFDLIRTGGAGSGRRVKYPDCVHDHVHELFPDPEGKRTGFKEK